jgi:SAM-dependent methyltransferase
VAGADTDMGRLYDRLRCPTCSSGLKLGARRCGRCGRLFEIDGGLLDLLPDDLRADADRFAEQYRALRVREGWAAPTGREGPDQAGGKWRRRVEAVKTAVAVLERDLPYDPRPVVGDVGAGGGWAARFFLRGDVIAFDLLDAPGLPVPPLRIRADMRRLPLKDSSVDGLLYAAAIHYVPIDDAIPEAARVLRPGGLLVAIESPMYVGQRAAGRAAERSARYYAAMGYAELAGHYHPVDVRRLKAALARSGFRIERMEMPPRWLGLWRGLTRSHAFATLVTRLNKVEVPAPGPNKAG